MGKYRNESKSLEDCYKSNIVFSLLRMCLFFSPLNSPEMLEKTFFTRLLLLPSWEDKGGDDPFVMSQSGLRLLLFFKTEKASIGLIKSSL